MVFHFISSQTKQDEIDKSSKLNRKLWNLNHCPLYPSTVINNHAPSIHSSKLNAYNHTFYNPIQYSFLVPFMISYTVMIQFLSINQKTSHVLFVAFISVSWESKESKKQMVQTVRFNYNHTFFNPIQYTFPVSFMISYTLMIQFFIHRS